MKRIDELTEEEQKRALRYWAIVLIIASILLFANFFLLNTYLSDALGLKPRKLSFFNGLRILLAVFYVTMFLACSALAEFADSRTIKRPFRVRNIFLFWALFGEFVLIGAALLTLSDTFFSESSPLVQVPLTSLSVSIAIIITVATFRMKRFQGFFNKAFG